MLKGIKSKNAKRVISDLDEYLSACQLGITITALGLGWLGEPTFKIILNPVFAFLNLSENFTTVLSFILAFSIVTFMHVVMGNWRQKHLPSKAEFVTLNLSGPLILFHNITYPIIKLLNGSARGLTGLFGLK